MYWLVVVVVGSDRDVDGLLLASLLSSAVGWAAGGGSGAAAFPAKLMSTSG